MGTTINLGEHGDVDLGFDVDEVPVNQNALKTESIDDLQFLKYPGVDTLINHSKSNVQLGKTLQRESGQKSTISSMTFGDDRFEYLVPTIYDGKQVSGEEAIKRAREQMAKGVRYPTAPAGQWEKLDALSKQISSYLGQNALSPKGIEKEPPNLDIANALRPIDAD